MPKSQRQKKASAADFTKSKLKLGKTKQLPNNATNTSYSAKAIALPNQNIRTEKTNIPTTKSNLTLDDLIVRLRHYSPSTRKEALVGLRDILGAHRDLWRFNLGTIIHSCARLISDENPAVRKALRGFFAWFFPLIDSTLLEPFCSVIIFFTSSALSHIFSDIRVDAIHLVDLLLEVAPTSVVAGWPQDGCTSRQSSKTSTVSPNAPHQHGLRLLQHYLSILSIGSDSIAPGLSSTSASQLSGNSKLIVLKSLARFISVATRTEDQQTHQASMPLWVFRGAFVNQRDFDMFRALLTESGSTQGSKHLNLISPSSMFNEDTSTSHQFEMFTEAFLEPAVFNSENDINFQSDSTWPSQQGSHGEATPDTALKLLRVLHPVMLSIFLDAAPTAFQSGLNPSSLSSAPLSSGASPSSSLELVLCALSALHRLWRASVSADLKIEGNDLKSLSTILEKMAPYFVFGDDELVPQGSESKQILRTLNLIYSDLVCLLALLKMTPDKSLEIQLDRVEEFIFQLLSGQTIDLKTSSGPIEPGAYAAMLPIVWSLLRHGSFQCPTSEVDRSKHGSDHVLEAFIDHLDAVSPGSEVKALGINFLARLCIMDDLPGCQTNGQLDSLPPQTQSKLRNWMLGLPKLLWVSGNKHPTMSHLILAFLHRVVSRPMIFFADCLPSLPPLLVPFFSTIHPTTGRTLSGPHCRLPESCKKIAQGLGWYLVHDDESKGEADGLRLALVEAGAVVV